MNENGKKLGLLCLCLSLLAACDTPEEAAKNHLQKGKEFFEKGELDKAILELKTSSQDDKRGETYYYMALLDEKRNNFKSMKQNLIRTLELDPGMMDAHLKLAKVELLFGNLEGAQTQVDTILATTPDSVDAQTIRAAILIRQDKKDEAEKIIDKVLSGNPDNTEAISLKSGQLFQRNQIDDALALLDRALEKDANNIALRMFRIKINASRENADAMESDYKELIKLNPNAENFKLSLATLYTMTNKLAAAEELLQQMVKDAPDKSESKILLLDFLSVKFKDKLIPQFEQWLSSGQIPAKQMLDLSRWMVSSGYEIQAEKGFRQIIGTEKDSPLGLTARTYLGEIAMSKKEYDEANAIADNILKTNSEFVEASVLKARLMLAQNKIDEAIELLNKAIWSKSDTGDAQMLLGQAYLAKKDRKQADKSFKQALEINPANIGAFLPVYNSYLQANQKETARQYLQKALALKPNQDLLLTSEAELDIEEKKWDEAEAAVKRLSMFSKNQTVPVYLRANILQGKGKYAEAVEIYQKLLDDFPDHLNSMINLARSWEALKSRDKTIAFFEAHHLKHPESLTVVGVLGDIYVSNKDTTKAKQLYIDQIKKMPTAVALYLELAKIEMLIHNNPEAAKEVYLNGLKANPDEPRLLMALASVYEQTGDKSNAKLTYERLLEKTPNQELASNNLAVLLVESDSPEEQKKGLAMAQQFKDAENPFTQDTYAWALVRNGQTTEGLKLLESLVSKEPKSPELKYHLGVAYFKNGNKATAIAELKQAMALAEKQQRNFSAKNDIKKVLQEIEQSTSK